MKFISKKNGASLLIMEPSKDLTSLSSPVVHAEILFICLMTSVNILQQILLIINWSQLEMRIFGHGFSIAGYIYIYILVKTISFRCWINRLIKN